VLYPFRFAAVLVHREWTVPGEVGLAVGAERSRIEHDLSTWLGGRRLEEDRPATSFAGLDGPTASEFYENFCSRPMTSIAQS
jgi:hypothetical protein